MARWVTTALTLLVAACAPLDAGPTTFRAAGWTPREIREPAVFVRVAAAPEIAADQGRALEAEYLGALLEGLNTWAVAARDAGVVRTLDPAAALARVREVGADAAVLIEVTIHRVPRIFCRAERRPFRATATVWRPVARVLRASDGATRLTLADPDLAVTDVDANCDDPRASRRRTPSETLAESLRRLLPRLVGP